MADLTISGAAAGQPTLDTTSVSPFSGVTIASTAANTPYATAVVTLSAPADGALSHLGVGTLSADGATYTVSGSPALVQAALRALVFTPTLHQVAVGASVTTGFGLTVSDASGSVGDDRTTVVATAADTAPTITDTSGQHAASPSVVATSGADPTDPGLTSFTPFAYTTIADPDAGARETVAITLAQNGAASDAVGLLSGAGLTKTGAGTYVLSAADPAGESAALQALRFTPADPAAGASLDVTLSVSDGFAPAVTAASTMELVRNPGGAVVESVSTSTTTTFVDTAASAPTHTYATVIEGVLNGTTVVYEQSFAVPYGDPQVQAAVTQAQAAVRAAGATPGAAQQSASNTAVLSSGVSTTETGRTEDVHSASVTDFGPNYLGPGALVGGVPGRGFLYVKAGQLDINTNVETDYTVSRTVTTTSADLLSQKYVVAGSTSGGPSTATTLVSSNAQGVEGDSTSTGATVDGRPVFTGDGSAVLFSSYADNLVTPDAPGAGGYPTYDLYLKTLATGAIARVDTTATGVQPDADVVSGTISGDGRSVVFATAATNLDPRATDGAAHVYEKNLATGVLTLIAPGDYLIHNAATGAIETLAAGAVLQAPAVSADGRYVAAVASVPVNGFANSSSGELLVFDTLTHTAVDVTGAAPAPIGSQAFSAAGSTLVFSTGAHLVAADASRGANTYGVYTFNAATGATTLASTDAGGATANATSYRASISADGTKVAFASGATNLSPADADSTSDVYVKDLTTGGVTLVDVTAAGVKGNGYASTDPSISADGTSVSFTSFATNLDPRATDGAFHIYLRNLATGALTLVDVAPDGAVGNYNADSSAISPDGSKVAFVSTETNLVPNYVDGVGSNVFVAAPAVSVPAGPPPVITGVPATESDPGQAAIHPFAAAVVTGQETGNTFTVSLEADRHGTQQAGGSFSGGGFTPAGPDGATFSSSSLAAIQAALRAVSFTPGAADVDLYYSVSNNTVGAGNSNSYTVEILAPVAPPTNTPPTIGGAQADQADAAGVAVSPFSTVTVTDPDAGQSETVTVSFNAADGVLSGGGFTQTAPGVYTVTESAGQASAGAGATAAASQAALRAAVFTPTAGQSATTHFTITVSDGQATATNTIASVVATYTPPQPPSGGGGYVAAPPPSAALLVEVQNLARALATGADASTPGSPLYAQFQAEKALGAQLDRGQLTQAQAEAELAHLVDGTTAVAVASYGFFTGYAPTANGLNYLVHSAANATDLNDAYYARFSTENRFINFAVNLATGGGAGAAAFQAGYGALALADATAKAYLAVFGAVADSAKVSAILNGLVPDGLGGQETRAQYFAQYGGDGPNGQGTKAAMIGFLLSQAVHDGSGVYGAATEHYLDALAHGTAPVGGSELALTYGPPPSLVGVTPAPDPTLIG